LIWLYIIIGLLIAALAVFYYFFRLTFIKRNVGNVDDVNDPCNKMLGDFKGVIGEGIDYINSTPCKWVEALSFDGLLLKARYFNNNSDKTIIIFHGYRSSAARDFSCAVSMYTAFGLNVLLVDQRAHGQSEGRLITFGVKESRDVFTWVDFVKEKFGTEKIMLGGMSMGATTVLLAGGQGLPNEVKGIIADCGFTSPAEIIKLVGKRDYKINAAAFIPILDLGCKIFGKFSIKNVSTADAVKNCDLPILFIHGADDGFVPCEMSREAFKNCNEKCRLLVVEGADHGFSFLVDKPRVLNEIKEFLNSIEC